MCGIAGFIDFNKSSTKNDLVNMCNVLMHRGPDAGDYFFEEHDNYQIGLGHRRLSIIDLHQSANQPMFHKNFIIVFNGEIYNYAEIKDELIAKGRRFVTNSDTEVILQAFDEWGDCCVNQFIGMFAFLLYNRDTKEVITARDRTGVKPLHVYEGDNIIMWASELKSFHQHSRFTKRINKESVKSFVQLGYIPSPNSIFLNVSKQLPGTVLTYNLQTKEQSSWEYWSVNAVYTQQEKGIGYEEAKSELTKLLVSACNYRMVADVPIGVFLSGGYDSALVTSILQSGNSNQIKTFTIGVDDPKINEAKFAKEIASILGTDHIEVYLSEEEMFEQLEDLVFFYDEPFGDSSAIPTMLVSKVAKKDVTVALSADGGDELFGGYNRYSHLPYLNRVRRLNRIPFASIVVPLATTDLHKRERLKRLLNNPDAITLAKALNNPYHSQEVSQLFVEQITDNQLEQLGTEVPRENDLKAMLAFDYQTYLLDDILVKVDRATMRYSLEGREPLLDHRLLEFAASLPNDFKIRNGIKKYILKDIVHDYIPKSLMERPKMGFAAPVESWLKNNLKEKLDYFLSKPYIDTQGIFSFEVVNTLKEDVYKGKSKYPLKLWYILVFQLWYERWMR